LIQIETGIDDFAPMPLCANVEDVKMHREINLNIFPDGGDCACWRDEWFQFAVAGNGTALVVNCSVPEGAVTPIREYYRDDNALEEVVHYPSLTQMAEEWVKRLREGSGEFWNPQYSE